MFTIIRTYLISSVLFMGATSALAADTWTFGIGTGLSALDINGDAGFETSLVGPINFDASLEPDEVREYMETGFGFGGFAKKGDLSIAYSFGSMELEDTVKGSSGGISGALEVTYSRTRASVLADYAFFKSNTHRWGAIGGLRYSKHEYDTTLEINSIEVFSGSVDDDWIDIVIGISHAYPISRTLIWASQLDYGFVGSEGTAHFGTGITKIFSPNWMARFALNVIDIEYEEGNEGDEDWFYYDAKETTIGVSVMYMF